MPVRKDKRTGKWKIGRGKPIYRTKKSAQKAERGYYASRGRKRGGG